MRRETMPTTIRVSTWSSACAAAALSLALGAAWVPAAQGATPAFDPNDAAAPNSIIVDRMPSPIDSTGISYHAGQYVQYRVRAYGPKGQRILCNGGEPQVLTHDLVHAVSQQWPSYVGGNSLVNVIMGDSGGGAFLDVSCGSSVKKVILNNDADPLTLDQQAINNQMIQAANPPVPVPMPGDNGVAASSPPPAPQPAPAPEDSGSGVGSALLIAGAVAATVLVVAVAASGLSSSSGGGCSNGSHQCSPPNSNVCCPAGDAIYCTNNNTCTNQTLSNFGDICGSGNNSTASGC